MITIEQQVGDFRFTVQGNDVKELIEQLAFLNRWPSDCPLCRSPVRLQARHPKGYLFLGLECTGAPAHETTFGQHKEGGTLFYKEEWRVVPRGGGGGSDYTDEDEDYYEPPPERGQR